MSSLSYWRYAREKEGSRSQLLPSIRSPTVQQLVVCRNDKQSPDTTSQQAGEFSPCPSAATTFPELSGIPLAMAYFCASSRTPTPMMWAQRQMAFSSAFDSRSSSPSPNTPAVDLYRDPYYAALGKKRPTISLSGITVASAPGCSPTWLAKRAQKSLSSHQCPRDQLVHYGGHSSCAPDLANEVIATRSSSTDMVFCSSAT